MFFIFTIMKSILLSCLFLLLVSISYGQDAYNRVESLESEELLLKKNGTRLVTKPGQRYMVVDHNNLISGFHRYRFFPGETMKFRLKDSSIKFNEHIGEVSDSSFTFLMVNEAVGSVEHREVLLKDINKIKTVRRIPFITEAGVLLPIAGLVYIAADFFNKGIDNKRFTTDGQSLAIGGGLMVGGLICYKATISTIKIGNKNKIKILQTY